MLNIILSVVILVSALWLTVKVERREEKELGRITWNTHFTRILYVVTALNLAVQIAVALVY